jgi:hypothetical protein
LSKYTADGAVAASGELDAVIEVPALDDATPEDSFFFSRE